MKSFKIRPIVILLCFISPMFMFFECEEEEEFTSDYPDADVYVSFLCKGDSVLLTDTTSVVVIRSQEELNNVYIGETEFRNINFERFSLILGARQTNQNLIGFDYKLYRYENNRYLYNIKPTYFGSIPTYKYCYAIIVRKMPLDIEVDLEVTPTYLNQLVKKRE